MSYLILGLITGMSLILAIGAQNIFVIEQGLKKEFIFIVCLICSCSDLFLIFLGIFLFHYFNIFFNQLIELTLNILLFIFVIHFIWTKLKNKNKKFKLIVKNKKYSLIKIIFKTLGFTYLNPHVYSDTVFFLGNFSKDFLLHQKYLFATGASISSIFFFFTLGYLSKYLSNYLKNEKVWKLINFIIVLFMSSLALYILIRIFKDII